MLFVASAEIQHGVSSLFLKPLNYELFCECSCTEVEFLIHTINITMQVGVKKHAFSLIYMT